MIVVWRVVYSQSETERRTVINTGSNIQCYDFENSNRISKILTFLSYFLEQSWVGSHGSLRAIIQWNKEKKIRVKIEY